MEYKKPEILELANATDGIQGLTKPEGSVDIADQMNQFPSVGAYQADG